MYEGMTLRAIQSLMLDSWHRVKSTAEAAPEVRVRSRSHLSRDRRVLLISLRRHEERGSPYDATAPDYCAWSRRSPARRFGGTRAGGTQRSTSYRG